MENRDGLMWEDETHKEERKAYALAKAFFFSFLDDDEEMAKLLISAGARADLVYYENSKFLAENKMVDFGHLENFIEKLIPKDE